jgi:hypothetical protein
VARRNYRKYSQHTDEELAKLIRPCSHLRSERTLQFYALRHRWTWRLSSKTRDTVTQMRNRFGKHLDVITLMGHVNPQPFIRSMTRYDSEFEVVDVGRNLILAEEIIKRLEEESERERNLRRLAEGRGEQSVYDELFNKTEERDALRRKFVKRILNNSFKSVCCDLTYSTRDESATSMALAEIIHPLACDLIDKITVDIDPPSETDSKDEDGDERTARDLWDLEHRLVTEQMLPAFKAQFIELTAAALGDSTRKITQADDEFTRAFQFARINARRNWIRRLERWISTLKEAKRARKTIADRYATPTSIAEKLGGMVPG